MEEKIFMDATLDRKKKIKPDKRFADKLRKLAYKHRSNEEKREKKQKIINSEKEILYILDHIEKKAKEGYFSANYRPDLIDYCCGIDWMYIIRKLQSYSLTVQKSDTDSIIIDWQEQKATT